MKLEEILTEQTVKEALKEYIRENFDEELYSKLEREIRADLQEKAQKYFVDKMEKELAIIATDFLNQPIPNTNQWGEKKGEPETITERAIKIMKEWMEEKVDSNCSRSYNGINRLEQIVRQHLDKSTEKQILEIKFELRDAFTKAFIDDVSKTLVRAVKIDDKGNISVAQ
jgi:hypothetical protein